MAPRDILAQLGIGERRDVPGSLDLDAAPMQPVASAQTASSTSTYLGIGVGVGGALLVAIVLVVVQIVRERAAHKRGLAALDHGQIVQVPAVQTADVSEVPRPVIHVRRGSLLLAHAKGGWGTLGSSEEINEPDIANHPSNKKRSSISLPKRFRQRGMPLKRLKHLSVIPESPRNRVTSPAPARAQSPELQPQKSRSWNTFSRSSSIKKLPSKDGDVFIESPKPEVLPSHAIRSPGRYGALFAAEDNPKAVRSKSVSAIWGSIPDGAVFGMTARAARPPMHGRSISLGASGAASLPPSGPVPALPVIAPHDMRTADGARQGMIVSRTSTLSQGSASSSILVTSPLLRGPDADDIVESPSVEQMVAEDDSASLKTVSHRRWHDSQSTVSRVTTDRLPAFPGGAIAHQASVRSNAARYSTDSQISRELSFASITSSIDVAVHNRLSIPQVGTADRMSISRIPSTNSFKSDSGVKKITTPRKVSRCSTTVSADGSPSERRKSGVLRDISGSASTTTRKASSATQDSSRSSNGNPFQWDSAPLQKPSAMKGSPNARKGHRRQNCVRISTLAPHVLGPPPSRPRSPVMYGIEEEGSEGVDANQDGAWPLASNQQRLSRPSSASVFVPNLRIQTLRASLTPSSPTLSAWTAYQEHGLPSQPSDSSLTESVLPSAAATRSTSRQSGHSSAFSIPAFPSPSKTTLAAIQIEQPVPEFSFTRPSTDDDYIEDLREQDRSPPFALDLPDGLDFDVHSSPLLPASKFNEYDPAWPMLSVPTRSGSQEYDPASPAFGDLVKDSELSSPFSASMVTISDIDISPRSRPVSGLTAYQVESPPCSPKSIPVDYRNAFASFPVQLHDGSPPSMTQSPVSPTPRVEPLTSANASSVMAHLPVIRLPHLDFPSAPVLRPPVDTSPIPFPLRPRSVTTSFQRSSGTSPPPLPARNESRDKPSPLHLSPDKSMHEAQKHPPLGPRSAPAKSVLKNAQALRRMNSEIDTSANRQSRRYANGLVREPSPLLPFICSPDPSEDGEGPGVFDFDFGSGSGFGLGLDAVDAGAGAADGDDAIWDSKRMSALDDVDMADIERRLEGALAGFDAPISPDSARQGRVNELSMAASKEHRNSSVWEDGENYWRRSLSTIPGSTPDAAEKLGLDLNDQTPTAARNRKKAIAMTHCRASGKTESWRSPSVMETPRSLYDADGFLKT